MSIRTRVVPRKLPMYLETCIVMSKKLTNSRFIHLSTEPMPVGPDYPDIIGPEIIVTPEIINDV